MTRGERGKSFRGKVCRLCRNNYKGHMDNNWAEGGGNEREVDITRFQQQLAPEA